MSKMYYRISQGVYVLTTFGGGCIVDAVSQISSGENPLISIAVMKENYTNELAHNNTKLILSVLGKKVDGKIIENFGYHSMKDFNKFEGIETMDVDGIKVPLDSLGYMELEVEERIENETHTLIIARCQNGKTLKEDDEELTYQFFRKHKEEYIKTKNEEGKTVWVCTVCGYTYEGEELPEGFTCPVCGVDSSYFEKK